MAQFTCEYCGKGFEQRSRYERHLQTSHPPRAPDAADVEQALRGIDFPASRATLEDAARNNGEDNILSIIRSLPERDYRDAAEVAEGLGEAIGHRPAPARQPGKKGGENAMNALSAARIASLFSGIKFPATAQDLVEHARKTASQDEMALVSRLSDITYRDITDVTREFGRCIDK